VSTNISLLRGHIRLVSTHILFVSANTQSVSAHARFVSSHISLVSRHIRLVSCHKVLVSTHPTAPPRPRNSQSGQPTLRNGCQNGAQKLALSAVEWRRLARSGNPAAKVGPCRVKAYPERSRRAQRRPAHRLRLRSVYRPPHKTPKQNNHQPC
jgi:hypothetical protein